MPHRPALHAPRPAAPPIPVRARVWRVCATGLALALLTLCAQAGSLRERLHERLSAGRPAAGSAATEPVSAPVSAPVTAPAQPALPALPTLPALPPGTHEHRLNVAGSERRYLLHVPKSFRASQPATVLYFFHGGGGNMRHAANDRFYGQITASERHGHLVVFPNGHGRLPGGKLATWNAGRCCGAARDDHIDDLGFVRALHAQLQSQTRIDPQRVFAAGMSNGAMMAYRLACEASDLFRGITAVAGTDNTRQCQPARSVSVLHIHARDDERVLFNGGAGQPSPQVTDFTSVDDSVARWVNHNGCTATPTTVLEVPGAKCTAHTHCRDDTRVQLCVTDTGGHAWPGGSKVRGGEGSSALSATEAMMRFFLSL